MTPGQREGGIGEKEGDVRPEPMGHLEQFRGGNGAVGELVHRPERRGRIAGATAEAAAGRNPLDQPHRHAEAPPRGGEHGIGGPPGEVLLGGADIGTLDVERDPGLGAGDLKGVVQGDPAEERLDAVVAGGFASEDAEEEVDLGGAGERERVAHAAASGIASRRKPVVTADQAPIRVIGTKVVTWYISP